MKFLLDTHTLLWSLFSPRQLSPTVAQTIISRENDISVSVVTFWEISLKYAIGKLELQGVEPEQLPDYTRQMNISIVPIAPSDAASFHRLPRLKHKDPFDRLMIWQAIQQKFILITKDQEIDNYVKFGLKTIW